MTINLLFWILMLLWVIFGVVPQWPTQGGNFRPFGGSILLFILIALLGWHVFGPALHS